MAKNLVLEMRKKLGTAELTAVCFIRSAGMFSKEKIIKLLRLVYILASKLAITAHTIREEPV